MKALALLGATMLALAQPLAAAQEVAPLTLEAAIQGARKAKPRSEQAPAFRALTPAPRPVPDKTDLQRIEAMARFFDVLLVDLDEAAFAARMSTAYGRWQRLLQSNAGGLETLRAHHFYLDLLSKLNETRASQRLARLALSRATSDGGQPPSELIEPALPKPSAADRQPAETAPRDDRWSDEIIATRLELEWLVAHEWPRTQALEAVAARVADDAREKLDAGGSADLGNASAAVIEALKESRQVLYRVAIARERLAAFTRRSR